MFTSMQFPAMGILERCKDFFTYRTVHWLHRLQWNHIKNTWKTHLFFVRFPAWQQTPPPSNINTFQKCIKNTSKTGIKNHRTHWKMGLKNASIAYAYVNLALLNFRVPKAISYICYNHRVNSYSSIMALPQLYHCFKKRLLLNNWISMCFMIIYAVLSICSPVHIIVMFILFFIVLPKLWADIHLYNPVLLFL